MKRVLTREDKAFFFSCVKKLNEETSFMQLRTYKHHLHTNTYYHSVAVAYVSFYLCRLFRWQCDEEKLIYAALLHDYFLYDCHDGTRSKHFITHAKVSLENAIRDWEIDELQANIIRRHMFPCTLIPPKYKESVLVNVVDKLCACYEMTMPRPYHKKILGWC